MDISCSMRPSPTNPQSRHFHLLSIYAVVLMDFWPDVTHKGQEVIQDFIPVLLKVVLEDGHLLLGLLLHLTATAAMGPQRRSFLGLELLLPLQAILFNLSLGFFFGLLQPPVLPCFQRETEFKKCLKAEQPSRWFSRKKIVKTSEKYTQEEGIQI